MSFSPPEGGSDKNENMSKAQSGPEAAPSAKMLQEAMPDAKQIQSDLKAGNTSGLMKDALALNNKNNPEYTRAVQADLAKMGFPNVDISTENGAGGKPFTDILQSTTNKDGSTTLNQYWAGANTPGDAANATGHSTDTFSAQPSGGLGGMQRDSHGGMEQKASPPPETPAPTQPKTPHGYGRELAV